MSIKVTAKIQRKSKGKLEAALRGLMNMGRGPQHVKVGFPAGKSEGDIVQRAVWNEFGNRGGASGGGWGGPVPERPFMRNAMRDNRDKYQRAMTAAAKDIVQAAVNGGSGSGAERQALAKLGALAQGDIQKEITSLRSPPNAEATIKLKGSSNPLVDTGEMRSKVTFLVDEG